MKTTNFHMLRIEKFKTITFGILIRSRLSKQTATKNALIAHVIKRGSKNYPSAFAIAVKMETLYGAFFDIGTVKKGEEQILQFMIEFPAAMVSSENITEEAIRFLLELLQNPKTEGHGFDNKNVAAAKTELRQLIEGKINDKKAYAVERCIEEAFSGDPFSVSADGYTEDLDTITPDALLSHYKQLLQTAPIEIFATGDVTEDQITNITAKYFDLHAFLNINRTNPSTFEKVMIKAERNAIYEKKEQQNISQAKLCICQTTGIEPTGDDYYGLLVANAILGGGATSMLFQNLREKESLCYYVSSVIYRFKSVMLIQAGIDESSYEKVLQVLEQLNNALRDGSFTPEDLESAKKGLLNSFAVAHDDPSMLTDYLITGYLLGDQTTLEEAWQKIASITAEDVMRVSKKIKPDTVYLLKGCAVC